MSKRYKFKATLYYTVNKLIFLTKVLVKKPNIFIQKYISKSPSLWSRVYVCVSVDGYEHYINGHSFKCIDGTHSWRLHKVIRYEMIEYEI